MLRLVALRLEAGAFRLGPLDLEVAAGECCALVGPSGSGKTKVLEAVAGVFAPRAGAIWIAGRDLTAAPPEARAIGWVPQPPLLFPHLEVAANLAFAPGGGDAEELIARLALAPLLARSPDALSGGERQRVALARALYRRPRLLLLDEPDSGMDAASRAAAEALVAERRRAGAAVLLAAHAPADAAGAGQLVPLIRSAR